jgi:hypothetical protein
MDSIKNLFLNLSNYVDKNPYMGILLIIIFTGSFGLLIYNFGKDIGAYLYYIKSNH